MRRVSTTRSTRECRPSPDRHGIDAPHHPQNSHKSLSAISEPLAFPPANILFALSGHIPALLLSCSSTPEPNYQPLLVFNDASKLKLRLSADAHFREYFAAQTPTAGSFPGNMVKASLHIAIASVFVAVWSRTGEGKGKYS